MIAPDLAEVVGMRRKSSDWIRALLRQHPDVVTRHRTIRKAGAGLSRAEFFAFEAFPPEPPRITDLWRGWRNPVTGYQPARLGLDQPETTEGA
jgi:hypothetical protein